MIEHAGGVATIGGPERLFLRGERPVRAEGSRADAAFTLRAGERAGWVLHRVPGTYGEAPAPLDPHAAIADTTAAWQSWSAMHGGYEGVAEDAVRFAAVVIQGLTYQPSGAVVAAPTTSLPERPGGDANWDYRFGWLRDAAMIARALSASSCSDEALRYFDWMVRAGVTCGEADRMQIVFGVEGERDLAEHDLGTSRASGSRPCGSATRRASSSSTCSARCSARLGDPRPARHSRAFTAALPAPARRSRRCTSGASRTRASGRGARASATTSCPSSAAGRRSTARWRWPIGSARAPTSPAGPPSATRSAPSCSATAGARSAARSPARSARDRLDAGVLLMPMCGIVRYDDPRMTATIERLEDELGDDGLLRRWSGAEDGAFLLASFWLAECHARAGRVERAHEVFARAAGAANDLGLLSEEVDTATGEPLGNMPQAIAHIGLVNAAQALTEVEAEAGGAVSVAVITGASVGRRAGRPLDAFAPRRATSR